MKVVMKGICSHSLVGELIPLQFHHRDRLVEVFLDATQRSIRELVAFKVDVQEFPVGLEHGACRLQERLVKGCASLSLTQQSSLVSTKRIHAEEEKWLSPW